MLRRNVLATFVAALTTSAAAPASTMEAVRPSGEVLASGRVVKVAVNSGEITIAHKPIWRLYLMESQTRTFKVRDASMLIGMTPGDSIRFAVERTESGFAITWIENSIR